MTISGLSLPNAPLAMGSRVRGFTGFISHRNEPFMKLLLPSYICINVETSTPGPPDILVLKKLFRQAARTN